MDLSGRFLPDPRAPKAPLDYRALATALAAYQSTTPTARVVAAPANAPERPSRALAVQVLGASGEGR